MRETASRLLGLLSLLQGRRDWPGNQLADRLEVSGRTIRRDVERLRRLGYPVESVSGPAGGYRLRAGTAMPPLLLDDEEAIAIAVGLRTAAGASITGIGEAAVRALVKLEQVLPARLRRRVHALGSMTTTHPVAGPTVDPQHLSVIATACRDSECLRFGYRSRDRTHSHREVEPHSLVDYGRRWYLVACAPNRYEAAVTLHAGAAQLASRIPAHWGTIEPIDAHTCIYRTGDDDLSWLAWRIAMLGVDFEVHEPPDLIEHLRLLASRLMHAAG